jgi:Zn-dependent protease
MQFDLIIATFQIAVLLFSVVIHEVSHGAVALALGDTTAKDAGRLTLNPLKHLDLFGSIILPLVLIVLGGVVFGWAKPVPYNPYRLRDPKKGGALIGFAGPAANLVLAGVFAGALRYLAVSPYAQVGGTFLAAAFFSIVLVNLFLAVFNLIPIPPLDGSKLLFAILPPSMDGLRAMLERYGIIIFIFFIFYISDFIGPIVGWLTQLLIGDTTLSAFSTF